MIKRTLLNKVKAHLKNKEITLIIGPRQAGKTTLMQALQHDLKKNSFKTLFLSLDNEADKPFFDSQQNLLRKIALEIGREKGFVFIDEIQRKENAGLFLKGLYDMSLPYKFIVSGSGSIELKERVRESLVGRKRVFELSTLSFKEFCNFRLNYEYEGRLIEYFDLHKSKLTSLLEEYLNFGGYPKVVLAETLKEKKIVIDDIYKSYLEKDIAQLLNIRKTDSIIHLVKILAAQIGGLVNVSELSLSLSRAVQTINHYLWYLEKTFIIKKVPPYFKNVRKEITKMSVYYFVDLGLRNYALGQFGSAFISQHNGYLFENFVFNILREKASENLNSVHFWRSHNKAEVDFVVDKGLDTIPLEAKYTILKQPKITRSFRSFIDKYKPTRAYVVHLGQELPSIMQGGTRISFIPFYKLGQVKV